MTYDLSRLRQLGKRHQRLREQLDELRPEIATEIKAALAAGARMTDVARESGYTRDGIRKMILADQATVTTERGGVAKGQSRG